ncbi:MAG: M48 family metalloprotease [Thermodesulfobacteriota bacterium]
MSIRTLFAGALLVAVTGCVEAQEFGKQVGANLLAATGVVTHEQASSLIDASVKISDAVQELTPEQEHYIGRTVGATLLQGYPLHEDPQATRYLNLLGQTLVKVSGASETFSGYHFVALDTNEINAFAAPGGFIFVTRGMLRLCKSEEMVAAVLAHEIAHVELKHGLQAIKTSRLTSATALLAVEGAKSAGSPEFRQLTALFGESIQDAVTTLVDKGYSRATELEADQTAVKILERSGYEAAPLLALLESMERTSQEQGGFAFLKTHPAPADRLTELRAASPEMPVPAPSPEWRRKRFAAALGNV